MIYVLILFFYLLPAQLLSDQVLIQSACFPIHPPKAILSKYVKDHELDNCITIDSQDIHWRNRYKKMGVKYFSQAELENLVVTINSQGLLTYKGAPLVPGSYSYILSKDGQLLAFLRKNGEGRELNKELTTWFKQKALLDSTLLADVSTKEPLFYKVVCKHSSLSHGDDLLSVGDFEICANGVPAFFNNSSGHYRLKPIYMKNLAFYLNKAGVKDVRFDLFYKTQDKKIRKKVSSLLEVLNASDNAPLFVDLQ